MEVAVSGDVWRGQLAESMTGCSTWRSCAGLVKSIGVVHSGLQTRRVQPSTPLLLWPRILEPWSLVEWGFVNSACSPVVAPLRERNDALGGDLYNVMTTQPDI